MFDLSATAVLDVHLSFLCARVVARLSPVALVARRDQKGQRESERIALHKEQRMKNEGSRTENGERQTVAVRNRSAYFSLALGD